MNHYYKVAGEKGYNSLIKFFSNKEDAKEEKKRIKSFGYVKIYVKKINVNKFWRPCFIIGFDK